MAINNFKENRRSRRHNRIRKKVFGTDERPRLVCHRSLLNIHAQIIDDNTGKSILQVSTLDADVKKAFTDGAKGGNLKGAEALGSILARRAKEAGISNVVFDRGGYVYHGRVKALADSARKQGLVF
ncbi:MAG: 50S ribosomal protein L18 [Candidatus Omnitrophica bacterium]|nr:50S ribosomal protein L18 [Candidatus Omnitrophota bacterium]